MKLTLSLYQVAAITAAVSIGILWMYWKMQKLERQVKELSQQAFQQQRTPQKLAGVPAAVPVPVPPTSCADEEDCCLHETGSSSSGVSVASDDVKDIMERLETASASSADIERLADSIVAHIERSVKEPDPVATADSIVTSSSDSAQTSNAAEPFSIGFKNVSYDAGAGAGAADTGDLRKKTLEELRSLLKDRGLSTRGNKAELIQRLNE